MANKSFLVTWASGNNFTQIDHIMTTTNSRIFLKKLYANWIKEVNTDHKLLQGSICLREENEAQRGSVAQPRNTNETPDWDLTLLQNQQYRQKYHTALNLIEVDVGKGSTTDAWDAYTNKISCAASESISKLKKIPLSPTRRKAVANIKKWSFRTKRNPYRAENLKGLRDARADYTKICSKREEAEQKEFFENLKKYKIGERINRTYKYMNKFKKSSTRNSTPNISMRKWMNTEEEEDRLPHEIAHSDTEEDMPNIELIEEILKVNIWSYWLLMLSSEGDGVKRRRELF